MTRAVRQTVMLSGRQLNMRLIIRVQRVCVTRDRRTAGQFPPLRPTNYTTPLLNPVDLEKIWQISSSKLYFWKTVLRWWEKVWAQPSQPVLDQCAAGRQSRFFHNCDCWLLPNSGRNAEPLSIVPILLRLSTHSNQTQLKIPINIRSLKGKLRCCSRTALRSAAKLSCKAFLSFLQLWECETCGRKLWLLLGQFAPRGTEVLEMAAAQKRTHSTCRESAIHNKARLLTRELQRTTCPVTILICSTRYWNEPNTNGTILSPVFPSS